MSLENIEQFNVEPFKVSRTHFPIECLSETLYHASFLGDIESFNVPKNHSMSIQWTIQCFPDKLRYSMLSYIQCLSERLSILMLNHLMSSGDISPLYASRRHYTIQRLLETLNHSMSPWDNEPITPCLMTLNQWLPVSWHWTNHSLTITPWDLEPFNNSQRHVFSEM